MYSMYTQMHYISTGTYVYTHACMCASIKSQSSRTKGPGLNLLAQRDLDDS